MPHMITTLSHVAKRHLQSLNVFSRTLDVESVALQTFLCDCLREYESKGAKCDGDLFACRGEDLDYQGICG